ncbi:Tn3 family transposase [Zooshikella ganghwensis]|uniref:Tn3 family transposase n=1 Tax=Zooshikella ganghwensis TaxID=202772 RepID=UPI00041B28C0|nr:Tn3 family transposase [Zooshikella ganghwensis]
MSSIHETAYPRIKSNLSQKELDEVYTPSEEELQFSWRIARQSNARICLLILIKTVQRLGYFQQLTEIPLAIIQHITDCANAKRITQQRLKHYDSSGARQRHIKAIRTYLKIHPFNQGGEAFMVTVAERAADTKQDLNDIINEVIEELVKQRFELPGFTTLVKAARRARNKVNSGCFNALYKAMTASAKSAIGELLKVTDDNNSGWNRLKREPSQPKSKEIKSYLKHLQWLQTIASLMPPVQGISASRRHQYILEARSLHVHSIRELKPTKRYALAVILIHSQLQQALDNVADIFIRKMQNLHSAAEQSLQQYHLEHIKQTDKLIKQFRDMLKGYHNATDDSERLKAIKVAIKKDPVQLLEECEEYIAYSGNNYIPFMLPSYHHWRSLLFSCLECLTLKSTSHDHNLMRALQFVQAHRSSHKEWLSISAGNKNQLSLHWLPERWQKLVIKKNNDNVASEVHRKYFELCVFTQIMQELKSGDIYVIQGDKYADYREQLIDWDAYEQQVEEYGQLVGLSTDPQEFVKQLQQQFIQVAKVVDQAYPNNAFLELTAKGFTLRRHETEKKPKAIEDIDGLIKERMKEVSILDMLVETDSWFNLHQSFGPISGFEPKIDEPRKRFITTLFCYGCNLGPMQTARSVEGISRKQVAWLNLRYVTEERLEKVIVKVINAYNKFRLPKYWGSGNHASADGTKWNVYEQNLLSEYHIRYGGYGGIGYYHVSDQYIALFSHFIPCGVYEAIYILDGLIKNESDIQPDTVHGDTQAQSAPVFGLAYLLGINLMPRMRGVKKYTFFRPKKGVRYQHINSIFSDTINWDLIKTHLPDMLRVALSIKAGKITPSTILRRLGTKSRKNKLYFAFREFGRVIRSMFLLNYINDVELRKTVQSATNKSEEFNQFTQWLFFGNDSVIAENVRHEQRKIIKYNQLVSNLAILHNVEAMTRILKDLQAEGHEIDAQILKGLGPYRTSHYNRFGHYTLNLNQKVRPMSVNIKI